MRGPAPVPTALREIRGNPSGRPYNAHEPTLPAVVAFHPPVHLAAQAREVWCELAPEMTNAGLLTVGDVPLFASFCACEAQVRRLGVMVEDLDLANDFSQAAGRVRRAHAAALDKVLLIGREFGLTPSSRTRIGVEPAGKLTAEDIRAMLRA